MNSKPSPRSCAKETGVDTQDASQFPHITRRTFCNGLLLTSTGIVLAQETAAAQNLGAQQSLIAYPPRKIEGAESLMPGSSLYFDYPGRNDPAVLVRSAEGEFKAYSRRCSHAGCSVEFDAMRKCLKCPCHQGTYDARMGNVILGPPRKSLDEIVLQVKCGGEVWAVGKSLAPNPDWIAHKL